MFSYLYYFQIHNYKMDINSILIVLPITKGSFILGHYLLSRNLTQEVTFFWDASHEMKHMSQDFAELELLYDNGSDTHKQY